MGGKARSARLEMRLGPARDKLRDWPFDLDIFRVPSRSSWFQLGDGAGYEIVARTGDGGEFVRRLGKDRLVYVSSEGSAGDVATNLLALVEIVLAIPYWHDVLKFSRDGDLDEMRRAAIFCEEELQAQVTNIDKIRKDIENALGLRRARRPVDLLHEAVASSSAGEVVASDNSPCESLFGTFSVSDNPAWR